MCLRYCIDIGWIEQSDPAQYKPPVLDTSLVLSVPVLDSFSLSQRKPHFSDIKKGAVDTTSCGTAAKNPNFSVLSIHALYSVEKTVSPILTLPFFPDTIRVSTIFKILL